MKLTCCVQNDQSYPELAQFYLISEAMEGWACLVTIWDPQEFLEQVLQNVGMGNTEQQSTL